MKSERILNALSLVDEKYILEAAPEVREKKTHGWMKWVATAACACVVIGGSSVLMHNMGGNAGSGSNGGSSSGNGGLSGTVFMSYEGPVLPLSSLSNATGITAERKIDFDFSPYETVQESYEYEGETITYDRYHTESVVSDDYTLTNTTGENITFTAVYAFPGSFKDTVKYVPTISVDGEEAETTLYAGRYTGGFQGAGGDNEEGMQLNLADLTDWESYQALLMEDAYLQDALAAYPELSQEVIIYELTDISYDGNDESAVNPSLDFHFYIDPSKTLIMSYGSNGGAVDAETGENHRMFDVRDGYGTEGMNVLVVLGEDITDINLQGYKQGMYEKGEELSDFTYSMERYETTLDEILRRVIAEAREIGVRRYGEEDVLLNHVSDEMLFGSMAELLYDYGVLSSDVAERYDFGMLEDMEYESEIMKRILYLTFEVTVPANASVQVDISMIKDASFDYYGEGTDRNGYDMMTTLGSDLEFSSQRASVSGTEFVEIVGQNFGFDVGNGITEVELDLSVPHYYIEVRKVKE